MSLTLVGFTTATPHGEEANRRFPGRDLCCFYEANGVLLRLELADKRVRFEGNAEAGFNARGEIPVSRDAIERPKDCDK